MAKVQPIVEEKDSTETTVTKTTNPMVFVSHDTRDAELAEAFSNLLKTASAGGLKSFRSSDKKGKQGIEFGVDCFLTIMENIYKVDKLLLMFYQFSPLLQGTNPNHIQFLAFLSC